MKIYSLPLAGLKVMLLSLLTPVMVFAQTDNRKLQLNPDVIPMVFMGETVALRDFVADPNFPNEITKTAKPGYHPKTHWILNETVNPNALPQGMDPALQKDYALPLGNRELAQNYAGMGDTGVDPADPSIDVGPNHVIQMINGSSGSYFKIWNKTGTQVMAQTYFDTFFGAPGGAGDPIVVYDGPADRWLMSEFTSSNNRLSIAVSSTPDPLGTWYTYIVNCPQFPDYPKYSVWDNAYIVTTNESSAAVYALDRNNMLAGGAAATAQRFTMTNFGTIGFQAAAPVNLDGTTLPPSGTPAMVMRMRDDAWSGAASDALEIWAFNINWTTPANTSLTQISTLPVAAFESELCGYTSFACIPQPGSGTTLDPLREVLMNRVHYRNFGTHESIVCCHVTDVNGDDRAGVRWYELRRTGGTLGTWAIYQQGTYSPDAANRWMASIGISASGSIGLAYNVSSSSVYPSLRYTGRRDCDPLGTMTEPETTIISGSAANGSNRYGDYNALGTDPTDGETFWFTGMYNTSSGWSTRVAAFNMPSCSASVAFGANTASADEAAAAVDNGCEDYVILTIPIQIGSAPSAAASVTINVTGGTATSGADYTIPTSTFTLQDGSLAQNVQIYVYNDDYVEGNETITLGYSLNAGTGNAIAGALNQTVTVIINDDDELPNNAATSGIVMEEDFESGLGSFTTTNASGDPAWQVGTVADGSTNAFTIPNSNASDIAWINDDDCNCNQNNVSLISPVFSLSGYVSATLSFAAYFEGNTYQGETETAKVRISLNGGAYADLATITAGTAWSNQTVDLTPYVGNANVNISFVYSDGTGWLYGCAIDDVVIEAVSTAGIQTAVNTGSGDEASLGANGTVHFFDPTSGFVMATLENSSSFDFNCVTMEVDRQGNAPTAVSFASNVTSEFAMSKTFSIAPLVSNAGSYTVTLYYEEEEVAAWEAATGNSRNSLQMIRVASSQEFEAVTPANFTTFDILAEDAIIGDFNGDVTFTATFSGSTGSFGMGIFNADPQAPQAVFVSDETAICVGETISFTDQSTGNPNTWNWDFGDGGSASEQNPTHTYTEVGIYPVTLTVTNDFGMDGYTSISAIVVSGPTSGSGSATICEGESYAFNGNTLTSPGAYSQTLVNAAGCDSIYTLTLDVVSLPSVSIQPLSEDTLCVDGPSITLVGIPAGGTFSGTGVSGTIFNPVTAGLGLHEIDYNYTDPNGCSGASTVEVYVKGCVGVGEFELSDVTVYPNPNAGEFVIKGLEAGKLATIYDAQGKLVWSKRVLSSQEQIEVKGLAAGVYTLRSEKGGVEGSLRIIVMKK
jgi:PKD repeat protein